MCVADKEQPPAPEGASQSVRGKALGEGADISCVVNHPSSPSFPPFLPQSSFLFSRESFLKKTNLTSFLMKSLGGWKKNNEARPDQMEYAYFLCKDSWSLQTVFPM